MFKNILPVTNSEPYMSNPNEELSQSEIRNLNEEAHDACLELLQGSDVEEKYDKCVADFKRKHSM